jgi:hypothetical protein
MEINSGNSAKCAQGGDVIDMIRQQRLKNMGDTSRRHRHYVTTSLTSKGNQ